MRSEIHILQKTALRFRRWCRHRYAAFGSIGRCVSIGTLSKGIVEASLRKVVGLSLFAITPSGFADGTPSGDTPHPDKRESYAPFAPIPCIVLPQTVERASHPASRQLNNPHRLRLFYASSHLWLRQGYLYTYHNKNIS